MSRENGISVDISDGECGPVQIKAKIENHCFETGAVWYNVPISEG